MLFHDATDSETSRPEADVVSDIGDCGSTSTGIASQKSGSATAHGWYTTMLQELKQKLGDEVERLQHELNVTVPNEIRKAVELGDLRENSEYKAALERQQFVQARLGQLRQRLSKLSQIDIKQIPADRVGLGSHVVVEDQATKGKETYSLVFGDSVELEDGQCSMSSPIGLALVGRSLGDVTVLKLPAATRRLKIISLRTIHDDMRSV